MLNPPARSFEPYASPRVPFTRPVRSPRPGRRLPPAELAAHPASADDRGYELYLMCDDIEATVRELTAKASRSGRGHAAALGPHHHDADPGRRPPRAVRAATREPAPR